MSNCSLFVFYFMISNSSHKAFDDNFEEVYAKVSIRNMSSRHRYVNLFDLRQVSRYEIFPIRRMECIRIHRLYFLYLLYLFH